MSQAGQYETDDVVSPTMVVCTFPMAAGVVFDWHTHDDHQLAWASYGVLTVRSETTAWVLPPSRALFIPVGVPHETLADGIATLRSAYLRPGAFPISWTVCTPVNVTSLMAELIDLLEGPSITMSQQQNAESLLVDLLEPVAATTVNVKMPNEERARRVAEALERDPADGRSLSSWGRVVGASERTLARIFVNETGLPFGRWKSLLRIRTAMNALASGESVENTAHHVGYASSSAFVSAFRRETGVTPNTYFRGRSASHE